MDLPSGLFPSGFPTKTIYNAVYVLSDKTLLNDSGMYSITT